MLRLGYLFCAAAIISSVVITYFYWWAPAQQLADQKRANDVRRLETLTSREETAATAFDAAARPLLDNLREGTATISTYRTVDGAETDPRRGMQRADAMLRTFSSTNSRNALNQEELWKLRGPADEATNAKLAELDRQTAAGGVTRSDLDRQREEGLAKRRKRVATIGDIDRKLAELVAFEREVRERRDQWARRSEFVSGEFEGFGSTLMFVRLRGHQAELRLHGIDVLLDPAVLSPATQSLGSEPRDLKCRQAYRMTDGTPLYSCLLSPRGAPLPIAATPDDRRLDFAEALIRAGFVMASCDAPRRYVDSENMARTGRLRIWSRAQLRSFKERCN